VGSHEPGDVLELRTSESRVISAQAQGRNDFGSIELIVNGKVIHTQPSRKIEGHYEAEMNYNLRIDQPCWIALRIPQTEEKNELGGQLFAHTSPVYVTLKGKSVFSKAEANSMLAEMRESIVSISKQGQFDNDGQLMEINDFFQSAIHLLESKIAAHTASQEDN
jgi:hypothetical protein